jgi:hypothetical protein
MFNISICLWQNTNPIKSEYVVENQKSLLSSQEELEEMISTVKRKQEQHLQESQEAFDHLTSLSGNFWFQRS